MTKLYTIAIHVDGADIDVALARNLEATEAEVDPLFADDDLVFAEGCRDDGAVRITVLQIVDQILKETL